MYICLILGLLLSLMDDVVFTSSNLTQKYKSTENKYITVKYYIKSMDRKVCYSENKVNNIITKCEITGNIDLVIDLFIKYWDTMFRMPNKKIGEIAMYQVLSEKITLYSVDFNTAKIVIYDDGKLVNYYDDIGVNK